MRKSEFLNNLRRKYKVSFAEMQENMKENRDKIHQNVKEIFPPKDDKANLISAALLSVYTREREQDVVKSFCRHYHILDGNKIKEKIFLDKLNDHIKENTSLLVTTLIYNADIFGMLNTVCGIERHNLAIERIARRREIIQTLPFIDKPYDRNIAAKGRPQKKFEAFNDFSKPITIPGDPERNIKPGKLLTGQDILGTIRFRFAFAEYFSTLPHGLILYLEGREKPVRLRKTILDDPSTGELILESYPVFDIDDISEIKKIYYDSLSVEDLAAEKVK